MRAINWNQFAKHDRNVCGRYFRCNPVTGNVVTVPHRVATFENRDGITTRNLPPSDRLMYTDYNRRSDAEILQELRRLFGEEENWQGRYIYLGGDSIEPGNVDDVVWEEPYRDEVESSDDNVDVIIDNAGTGTSLYSDDHDGHRGKEVRGNCLLYTSPSPRDQRGARMPSSA